jgi:hypothetical protein
MASDADPLVSVVSRCILDFSEQRGRSKGEAQEDTVNHALHTLQGLAPARVCAFKSYLWRHSFSYAPINALSRFKTIALYTWRFSSDFLLTTPGETPQYPTTSLASSL